MEKSRKLYKYQTVRYFLGANTDEFLNVGVLLIDEDKKEFLFIKDKHLNKLNSMLLNSKIENIVDSISKLNKSNIESWYGNYLKLSEIKLYRSSENFEKILNILYYDHVAFKFEEKEDI